MIDTCLGDEAEFPRAGTMTTAPDHCRTFPCSAGGRALTTSLPPLDDQQRQTASKGFNCSQRCSHSTKRQQRGRRNSNNRFRMSFALRNFTSISRRTPLRAYRFAASYHVSAARFAGKESSLSTRNPLQSHQKHPGVAQLYATLCTMFLFASPFSGGRS